MMKPVTLVLFLLTLVASSPVNAGSVTKTQDSVCYSGVCFPESWTADEQVLPLRGLATFRYWGFRVYTVAFYAETGVDTTREVLEDRPKKLVLHYHREISASDLTKSTQKLIERNPGNVVPELQERLDRLYAAYATVEEGDEYSIVYTPGEGTTVSLNGEPRITIEGEDFARAFMGIWLSEESVSDDLRDALVQGNVGDPVESET